MKIDTRLIALTGGVGAGKSRILDILKEEYHAHILQTDHIALELERPGQPGLEALVGEFGSGILQESGELDKDAFRKIIFSSEAARERVNEIIHPLVWKSVKQEADRLAPDLVVAESALMWDNPDGMFDEIWYVYTDQEERIKRLAQSRGYSRERSLAMMAGQPTEKECRELADFVIDNNGTVEAVSEMIRNYMEA